MNEAFTIITGYVDCGNWLVQNKCPVESVIYQWILIFLMFLYKNFFNNLFKRVITKYHIEHYDTPDYQSCPSNLKSLNN